MNKNLIKKSRQGALILAALICSAGLAQAQQYAEHGAHQHGKASLTFVLDGNEAELVLTTAAANIVGFEHKASSDAEKQQQQQQLEMLKSGSWFSLAEAANCSISGQNFREEQGEANHADLYVDFQILCQAPLKLSDISFSLFSQSPALESLNVQYLVNGEAGVAELSAQNAVLKLIR